MGKSDKILVSGGAGYIGSVLTEKLLDKGYKVVVLDNFTYTDMGIRHINDHSNLTIIRGDIRNRKVVQKAMKGVESVIHLAAIANDPSGELDPRLTQQVNYEVYSMLLEEAKKNNVRRFLNASTFGVYGKKDGINITEQEILNPLKEYSICKAKSEELVRDSNSENFAAISLRCATVCGWSPRMRFDLIVNTLTAHAIINDKITVWGGDQKRPQIHIDDLTDYFVKLIDMPGEKIGGKIYNAGAHNTSISEIAETIREVMGGKLEIVNAPPRDDERTYHVSSEKIAKELNLIPRKTIKDAIMDIIDAYERELWKNPNESIYHNVGRMKILGLDEQYEMGKKRINFCSRQ
jgi:nucleoside-diphosphate-sugar epimerase